MITLLDFKTCHTNAIKVKFIRNTGYIDVANNSSEIHIFSKDDAIVVVVLRSTG